MITNNVIKTMGSGSTVPDILITSVIINANPNIKNLYEIGTWVGGFIILVNSLTNGIKFYSAENMEAFDHGGKKNRKPLMNFENITDLNTLTYYIKETSLREYNKDINLSMFNSNDTAIEQINEPIDFIHFDCLLDGDTVYNMSKYLIDNKLSDHGVFCVDDYMPHCGFRSLAISKLVVENKLYPFYLADKKIFFCKNQQQQINYIVSIIKYINTKEFKELFEQHMPIHQYFDPASLDFNGVSHPHFTFDQG